MKKIKSPWESQSPLILAIETATNCGSVALVAGDRCLGEYALFSEQTHSQRLFVAIHTLVHAVRITWEEIDAVAVSTGPGSFTGLRIGLSGAKGLALASGLPLLGVSTLDGLANQLSFVSCQICSVLDARKKEVYAAFYRGNEDGSVKRQSEYMVLTPEHLGQQIHEPTIFIGDGIWTCQEMLNGLQKMVRVSSPLLYFPRASVIGMLGRQKFINGDFLDVGAAVPIYVRASDAEINFPRTGKTGKRS
jgi:tRNA threonylcarbamoyladenosine biosynthesis protein TsaB